MPDIQTEMKKVMQAWEQPYPIVEPPKPTEQPTEKKRHMFTPINNVSQDTFNYIRDNAGCPRKEATAFLVKKGHKKSSVTSLIGQMLRQGHVWKDSSGLLRPNGTEYTPLKSARTLINRKKKEMVAQPAETFKVKTSKPAKKYKVKDVPVPSGIAALIAEHESSIHKNVKVHIEPIMHDRVQQIMDTISLSEAKRLHKALNDYFNTP